MKLTLGVHAAARVAERTLALAWIEMTIATPDFTRQDPADPALTWSFKAIPAFGHRVLKVVHRPDGPGVFVVTAYFDRGARR